MSLDSETADVADKEDVESRTMRVMRWLPLCMEDQAEHGQNYMHCVPPE